MDFFLEEIYFFIFYCRYEFIVKKLFKKYNFVVRLMMERKNIFCVKKLYLKFWLLVGYIWIEFVVNICYYVVGIIRSDLNVIIFKIFIFLEIEFDNGNKKEKKRYV